MNNDGEHHFTGDQRIQQKLMQDETIHTYE